MRYRIQTERIDLFDVNIIITIMVKLEKEVEFEKLQDAFYRACGLHEILSSKVVIEPSGKAFYTDNDDPQNSILKTDLSLNELINENESKRFRIEQGEYIRAFDSKNGLVFMMHHLGGDGKSLLYFTETFMKCLSGTECKAVPFHNLLLDDLPKESRLPFSYKILTAVWNQKWKMSKRVFDFSDMDKAYCSFWKERKTKTQIIRYEKDKLDECLKEAKEIGISLTSYLITKMLQKDNKISDVGLAVDARFDKNRSMGNQVTGISVSYSYDDEKTFEDNAKAVHKLMRERLTHDRYRYFALQFMGRLDPTLKDALNLERAGYYNSEFTSKVAGYLGYKDRIRDLSITNLTRADIELDYGENRISEIVFVPPIVAYAKNVIGIVTSGDVMNVVRHTYE